VSLKYDEPATGPLVKTDTIGGENVEVMKLAFGASPTDGTVVDATAPLPVNASPSGSTSWAQATYGGGFVEAIRFAIPAGTQWLMLEISSTSMSAALQAGFSTDGGSTWTPDVTMVREVTHVFGYALGTWNANYAGGALPNRYTLIGPILPWITHFRVNVTGGAATGTAIFRVAALDKSWDISSLALSGDATGALGGLQVSGFDASTSKSQLIPTLDKFTIGDSGASGLAVSLVALGTKLSFQSRSAPSSTWVETGVLAISVGAPASVMDGTFYADVIALINTTTVQQDFTLTDGSDRDYGGEDLRPSEFRVLALHGLKFSGGVKVGAANAGLKIIAQGWQ
jgi:hypothetical protein